jgi:hypothetical protein
MKITLRNALDQGPVNVTFTKADGSRREMRATTNTNLFTYESRGGNVPEPQGVIRVWDLDKNEWRSIREDRVISFA